jgi:hypothetical protein
MSNTKTKIAESQSKSRDTLFLSLAIAFSLVLFAHIISEIVLLTAVIPANANLARLFVFNVGNNIPHLFSALVTVIAAVTFAVTGFRSQRNHQASLFWWCLALGATMVAALTVIGKSAAVMSTIAAFRLYPGLLSALAIVVLAIVVLAIRSILTLPSATRRHLLIAAIVFFLGAVMFEMVSKYFCLRRDARSGLLLYTITGTIEESLEIVGILLAIRAARLHLQTSTVA